LHEKEEQTKQKLSPAGHFTVISHKSEKAWWI